MKLPQNGHNCSAFAKQLLRIELQGGKEIVDRGVDISTILPATAFDVLAVRSINANMHAVPCAMAAPWAPSATAVGV